jgi:superfamily II DNA or RNA helicase
VKRYEIGVVDAPPRSGKTLMAARAIDVLGQPTVMLAPSVAIVKQSYEVFVKHFGYDLVARLDGDATTEEKDLSKPIVIATAQSAVRQPREWWDTRRMLVIDEFHHAAADTYHQINDLARTCYFRLMFTGTHFRTGEDRLAMEAICSQVLHKVGISELVSAGFLAPPRVVYAPVQAQSLASGDWQKVYRHCIVESEERNHLVSHVARTLAGNGIPTIVLVRHIKHAYTLKDMIPNSTVVKGGESALTGKSIEEFRQGSIPVLIGTTVIGEGVDLPNAGALVYASAGGSGVQQMQSYFRPLTAAPGKAVGLIYDFMDNHHATLSRWSRDRMSFTRSHLGEHSVVEL